MESDLPADWRSARLGDIAADIRYGLTASASDHAEDGPRFVRITDILTGRIAWDGVPFCDAGDVDLGRFGLRTGDIVIARIGASAGASARVDEPSTAAFASYLVRFRIDEGQADSRYIGFVLRSPLWKQYVRDEQTGSAQPQFNAPLMKAFVAPLPPIAEQRAIGSALSAFDEKIESNRRLAAAAADAYLQHALGRLGESARGGAKRVPLSELLVQSKTKAPDETAPYIGLDQMPRGATVLPEWLDEGAPKTATSFRRGDILFGKLRPYFKKVGVAPLDGRCSTEILVLRPKSGRNFGVGIAVAASQAFIDHCNAVSTGTRMPRSEWTAASRFEVPELENSVLAELDEMAHATYGMVAGLIAELRTLTAIRDALLPKLVSGKLRVRDAEDLIEEPSAA